MRIMAASRGNNRRYRDVVKIESVSTSTIFDVFSSMRITNDLTRPSEAAFEVADDEAWDNLENQTGLGKEWKVYVNDRLHLSGRVEMNDIPISESGAAVRFVIRTKLADAMFASANPAIRVESTSIGDFLYALYEPLGYTKTDFIFQADITRDLITGVSSDGSESPVELEELTEEQAKVNPPETIYAAADRHLKRHGLMHWDSPDGKITVGCPNDHQDPLFILRMYKGSRGIENNILEATRRKDWSAVPNVLGVFGTGGKKDWKKTKVRHVLVQPDVDAAGFYRPVLIINEGIKTDKLAEHHAKREMLNRVKNLDAWDVLVDGLSFWDGSKLIPYATDTMCDVYSSLAGGPTGAYLVHRVEKTRDESSGDTTRLALIKRGLWEL